MINNQKTMITKRNGRNLYHPIENILFDNTTELAISLKPPNCCNKSISKSSRNVEFAPQELNDHHKDEIHAVNIYSQNGEVVNAMPKYSDNKLPNCHRNGNVLLDTTTQFSIGIQSMLPNATTTTTPQPQVTSSFGTKRKHSRSDQFYDNSSNIASKRMKTHQDYANAKPHGFGHECE